MQNKQQTLGNRMTCQLCEETGHIAKSRPERNRHERIMLKCLLNLFKKMISTQQNAPRMPVICGTDYELRTTPADNRGSENFFTVQYESIFINSYNINTR